MVSHPFLQDAGEPGTSPLLTLENLDAVLVDRLLISAPEDYPQWPVHYLLGCYARCNQALSECSGLATHGATFADQVYTALINLRAELINYTGTNKPLLRSLRVQ